MSWTEDTGVRAATTVKAAGTTLAVSPIAAIVTTKRMAVAFCITDNPATTTGETTHHTVSDSQSNTWTRQFEYSLDVAGAETGLTVSIHTAPVTTEIGTGDSVTLTTPSVTARALGVTSFAYTNDAFRKVTDGTPAAGTSGDLSTGTVTVAVSGMTSGEHLYLGIDAIEATSAATTYEIAPDAAYTAIFGELDLDTTGGGAASNLKAYVQYLIATSTGDTMAAAAQDTDVTNFVSILLAMEEYATGAASGAAGERGVQRGMKRGVQRGLAHKMQMLNRLWRPVNLGLSLAGAR